MKSNKSIYWINACRALAIIGVYIFHVEQSCGYNLGRFNNMIAPWYVNAFFCVSGYLLYRKYLSPSIINEGFVLFLKTDGGKMVSNIIYRIVIPSIIFSVIEYFPASIIQGRDLSLVSFLYKTIGGGTYWFTSALCISELVTFFLLLTRRKSIWFYFICNLIISSLAIYYQNGLYPNEIWAWHRGLEACLFLGLGGLYCRYEETISKFLNIFTMILLFIVLLYIVFFCSENDPNISILNIQPLGIVASVISSLLLFEICKLMPHSRLLSYIGRNTLGLYFLSGALPILLSKTFFSVFSTIGFVGFAIIMSLSIFFGLVFIQILNRWFPFLLDIRILFDKKTEK